MSLRDEFTSTGGKLAFHHEAMKSLKSGKGQVITCHVMCTDICSHSCAFCSVGQRVGDVLPFSTVTGFIEKLIPRGLRSVILSGGGNPILFRCKETGKNFNDVVNWIHGKGLEIGLITDGMPMKVYPCGRESWKLVSPETLDKLTWIRISMAGMDHDEREVYVPDIDRTKTTIGMSYVAHDIFYEPADKAHGKVSTPGDLITIGAEREKLPAPWLFNDRIGELTEQLSFYATTYRPKYIRLTNNCLEPSTLNDRCDQLEAMAKIINFNADDEVAFVQKKNPKAPNGCWMFYVHPVMAPSGMVYPCDSVVIAAAALGYQEGKPNHKFDEKWAICHWTEVDKIFDAPVRSLIDSQKWCGGCLFSQQNAVLESVVSGTANLSLPMVPTPEHVNFV